jgi:hypothetical protein
MGRKKKSRAFLGYTGDFFKRAAEISMFSSPHGEKKAPGKNPKRF